MLQLLIQHLYKINYKANELLGEGLRKQGDIQILSLMLGNTEGT